MAPRATPAKATAGNAPPDKTPERDAIREEDVREALAKAAGIEPSDMAALAGLVANSRLMVIPANIDPDKIRVLDLASQAAVPPPVQVAIARVMAELPGIGKDDRSPEGYMFRGIEAIVGRLQDVCARHGVVYWSIEEIVEQLDNEAINMNPGWMEVRLRLTWYVQGPAGDFLRGPDGELPVTYGQGRDKSDKQIAKARTQARKGFLNTLFNIGDKREETESQEPPGEDQYQQHSTGGRQRGQRGQQQRTSDEPPAAAPQEWIDQDTWDRLNGLIKSLAPERQAWIREQWMAEDPMGEEDTLLPVVDGKPSMRHLKVNMVRQVESLVSQARQKTFPATEAPTPAPDALPAEDGRPAVLERMFPEAPPGSWNDVIDAVRALTTEALSDALTGEDLEVTDDPARNVATLVNHLGNLAGLDLATIEADAAARIAAQQTNEPAQEQPPAQ